MPMFELEHPRGGPPTYFVDRENGTPLLVIPDSGPPSECWQLPTAADELTTRSTVIDEVLEALEKVKLSTQARAVVEKTLDELPR